MRRCLRVRASRSCSPRSTCIPVPSANGSRPARKIRSSRTLLRPSAQEVRAYSLAASSCADRIQMPFGIVQRVGQRCLHLRCTPVQQRRRQPSARRTAAIRGVQLAISRSSAATVAPSARRWSRQLQKGMDRVAERSRFKRSFRPLEMRRFPERSLLRPSRRCGVAGSNRLAADRSSMEDAARIGRS